MKPYFKFRNSDSQYMYNTKNYADGMAQMILAENLIRKTFSQSGKKILLVGHYHAGGRIIEILRGLGPAGRIKLSNAKITHLKEMNEGAFRAISSNR